ncbi:MAG: hypothetical protein LQ342_002107 [Letrouitia transgressa]|nr:MAG: hypothetical protein LQ342_002107 [Letrouitia transgressa]
MLLLKVSSIPPSLLLTINVSKTDKKENSSLVLRRQSPPQPPATLLPILNLATNLWAIQTVGALTDPLQFTFLCSNFSLARLALEGYNTTSLSRTFCSAASSFGSGSSSSSTPTFPALDLINQLTIQYSTQIWITQAVGALSCNSTKGHGNEKRPNGQKAATLCQNKKLATLCHMLDVAGADAVGLDGTAVKNQICAAAEGHPVDVLPVPVF